MDAVIMFVDRMHNAQLKINEQFASVRPVLKEIQHQIKAAYAFHRHVLPQINVQTVTCALEMCAVYRALTIWVVLLANDAIIVYARKFVTQTTIVCREKFAAIVEHAKLDVRPKPIVHRHRFVKMENVNAEKASSERRLVAQTSTNAQKIRVTRAHCVKTRQVHSDVPVQRKLLEIHIRRQDVYCQINAHATKIVQTIWHVLKENAQTHAILLSVDAMRFVKAPIIRHFAIAHQAI